MQKNVLGFLFIVAVLGTVVFPLTVKVEAAADELVVITPHWSGITAVAEADFKAWYKAKTGRDVTITFDSKDTVTALALIRTAGGDPTKVQWDVWWGGGLDSFKIAMAEGLLAPYNLTGNPEWEDINTNVPEMFAGLPLKQNLTIWGAALSGFGIMYNQESLNSSNLMPPNDWTDLADPKYRGHIIMCPPSKSGSNLQVIQILLQVYGWDEGWALITKMGANVGEYAEKSHHVAPYVGRGEYAIAPIIDFYGFGQAAVYPDDVVFFYPPADSDVKNTIINPDSVAILKVTGNSTMGNMNPASALFMEWCLGKAVGEGQMMLFKDPINRLSVRPDVNMMAPAGYFNPFETEFELFSYNDTLGTLRLDIVKDLFDILLIATKDDLVSAMTAYDTAEDFIAKQKAAGYSVPNAEAKLSEAYTALMELPLNGSEVEMISSMYVDNREVYKADWLDSAVDRYSEALKLSKEALEEARSETTSLIESLRSDIEALEVTATNNLYYGLAGGAVIGLIVGFIVSRMSKK
jgi:ABC-type Fe3+ transport system substrate-binding protein